MNLIVQWFVVLGVWYCLLIDAVGNWVGQNHYPAWIPIIWAVTAVLAFLHGALAVSLRRT